MLKINSRKCPPPRQDDCIARISGLGLVKDLINFLSSLQRNHRRLKQSGLCGYPHYVCNDYIVGTLSLFPPYIWEWFQHLTPMNRKELNSLFTLHPSLKQINPSPPPRRGNCAFTLAEVLITLAIIGVVAALTIPNLITNYQKKVTVNGLKKVYSNLVNIAKMSEIENGKMTDWEYPEEQNDQTGALEFLKTYYYPYAKGAKLFTTEDASKMNYKIMSMSENEIGIFPGMILADGTILSIYTNCNSGYIWLYADINGFKKPNKIGRDIFVFDLFRWPINVYGPKPWGTPFNRAALTDINDSYVCNKDKKDAIRSGYYCGALIILDGWEILDDYPW